MRKSILIRGARQLLTLRGPQGPRCGVDLGQLGLLVDGSILIVDGRVQEAGQTRRVENLAAARNAREIDAAGRVVMPGFVDACIHLDASETGPIALASARRVLRLSLLHGTTSWGIQPEELLEAKLSRVLKKIDPSNETLVPIVDTSIRLLLPLVESCDARAFIDSGAAVAIASGYHSKNQPSCTLPMAIAAGTDQGFTIEEAIVASTINSAHVLGLGDRTGSIEVGKQADILILDASDYRDLARARGLNLVHSVMKHGEMIAEVSD